MALLHEVAGYDIDTVITQFHANSPSLAAAGEDAAFLVQHAEPGSGRLDVATRFWSRLLGSDRAVVPADALHRLGRWAFVTQLDDHTWAGLTDRTLNITGGQLDHRMHVADRAAASIPSALSRQILLRILDQGEPWERQYVADNALDVLRRSVDQPGDDSIARLRTRLIDLGHHDARDIAVEEHSN